MRKNSQDKQKMKSATGPDPARLKIDGSWTQAIKTALQKKKPPQGWPKTKKVAA